MTPERRREIDTLHKMYSENLAYQPQHAVNVLVDCVRDLSIDNNSLTAEIATLKAEVERLKRENRRRAACDLVNDRFKRSIENHEEREGRLKDELAKLKAEVERLQTIALCGDKSHLLVIRERDTLRTHLKAVVEAGEGANYQTPDTVGEYRYLLVYDSGDTWEDSGYCYSREAERIMNRHEAELQFSTRREDERPELYVLMPLKQHDALRSALYKAKE